MSRQTRRPNDLKTVTIAGAILVFGVLILAGLASLSNLNSPQATARPSLTPSLEAATIIDRPVGEVISEPIRISYAQPTATIIAPGATYVQPYFAKIDLAPGDTVTVSAADGSQLNTYDTTDAGMWAFPVEGATAVITLVAANPSVAGFSGVEVSQYGRGLTEPELAQSVCGVNDLTDVVCSAAGFPTEYGLRQPVARLLYTSGGSQFVCTTWRVSPGNFMVTNEHCIKSQAILNTAVIRFNYQRTSCGSGSTGGYVEVRGGSLLMVNSTYDVALYTIHPDDFAAVQQFGYLELDARSPVANETIFIPQHPAGSPKQFGLNSSQDGGRCRINAASLAGYAPGSDFGYSCDTQGGSSGSPIIALDTLKVIGLHHLGSGRPDGSVCGPSPYFNQGVKIEHVGPLLAPFLGPALAPGTAMPSNTASPTVTQLASATLTPSITLSPTPSETFTPSSTPTSTATRTPSSTPTVTPARVSTELLQDGGFENASPAWVVTNSTGNDMAKPFNRRSGAFAFRFRGNALEDTLLTQTVALDAISLAAGDQIELIGHIKVSGTVQGFMKLIITYSDGEIQRRKVKFSRADRFEPQVIEFFLNSADVKRIRVTFRHQTADVDAFVFIDDVSLLHSRALP